jgi:putative endonuclease
MTNNNNTVLYAGMTKNLLKRVYENKEKLIDGFTKNTIVKNLSIMKCLATPKTL